METDSAAISNRIYEGYAKPPRLTLKRHLFSMRMPGELLKPYGAISLSDKESEFENERLFRRAA